ncbi:hypothetical protein EV175_002162, partial [Coemansia sp. RSA 1933]
QARGYASPFVHEEASLDDELDIPKQVQQIVNPSNYTRINLVRDVSQSARVEKQDIGQQMEGAIKTEKEAVQARLDALFKRKIMPIDKPAKADLVAVLEGYYNIGSTNGCIKVLQKTRECNMVPSRAQYAMVLKLAAGKYQVQSIYKVAEEMRLAGLEDTNENYESFFNALLVCLGSCNQIEMAYSVYMEMYGRGLVPRQQGAHTTIVGLARIGEIDVALRILRESISSSITFDWSTYIGILSNASFHMHYNGYKLAFEQLNTVFGVQLTKGDYDAGLSIASIVGDYKLATSILETLGRLGYPIRNQEYEALFDSLLVTNRWETAFKVVGNMRQTGYGKTPMTLRTLVWALAADPDETEKLVDEAYAAMLKTSAEMPEILDTITLNALVEALAQAGYIVKAFENMNTWFYQHSVKRNVETYVGILTSCSRSKGTKTIAENVLAMMLDVDKLEPTKDVYELMIRISLRQFNYEDAFVYLESMKAQRMVPKRATYLAIARRCANVRDPRAKVALEEMRQLGYAVPSTLERQASSANARNRDNGDDDDDGSYDAVQTRRNSQKMDTTSGSDQSVDGLTDILGSDAFKT